MSTQSTEFPFLLFPLKIETRFIPGGSGQELWIRVYPDRAFLQSHNKYLTDQERADRDSYFSPSDEEEAQKMTWSALVERYGAYRAAYLVQQSNTLANDTNDQESAAEKTTFFYKGLPTKFIIQLFYYHDDEEQSIELLREHYKKYNNVPARLPIFEEVDDWLTDINAAENNGMAFKIELHKIEFATGQIPNTFSKILVFGTYDDETSGTPIDSTDAVAELLENHLYTHGIRFIPYGTATNNVDNESSGYSIKDEFAPLATQPYLEESLSIVDGKKGATKGMRLAGGLGLLDGKDRIIQHFQYADGSADDQFIALFKRLSWMALGGHSVQLLLGGQITKEAQIELWEHYSNYVKGRGWFSALKIDNQPYGILPVVHLDQNTDEEGNRFITNLSQVLNRLFQTYRPLVNAKEAGLPIPRFAPDKKDDESEDENYQLLSDILSMQVSSVQYNWLEHAYRKLRAKIPFWIQERLDISDTLGRMTVGEACQLLAEYADAGLADDYARIQRSINILVGSFGADELDKVELEKLPIYSFKEVLDDNAKPLPDDLSAFPVEDLVALREVFTQILADSRRPAPRDTGYQITDGETTKEVASTFIQYRGSNSFLAHILLKSYANTMRLFAEDWAQLSAQMNAFASSALAMIDALDPEKNEGITPRDKLQGALAEAIDLSSYRLDAWISSLAHRRLEKMRETKPTGLHVGAYGWVEELHRDSKGPAKLDNGVLIDENLQLEGGIIHAPTPAQSLVGTLFKNAYLNNLVAEEVAEKEKANPFTLNLSSERIQESIQFMQGIREDQEIEALLGYKLERYLHDHEDQLDHLIYILRDHFPLEVDIVNRNEQAPDIGFKSLGVIDGLAVLREYQRSVYGQDEDQASLILPGILSTDEYNKIIPLIQRLENLLDGTLDHLFFEAGFQLAQNNLPQSAAAMDAFLGDVEPPQTEALKTKLSGRGINHRLVYVFNMARRITDPKVGRAFLEPTLDTWLLKQIGKELDKIGCVVELSKTVREEADGETVETLVLERQNVRLSSLGITHSDLFYFGDQEVSQGASELELRIIQQLEAFDPSFTYTITEEAPEGCASLADALEMSRAAMKLFRASRLLRPQDLNMDVKELPPPTGALNNIAIRISALWKAAKDWNPTLPEQLEALAQLNLPSAKRAFLNQEPLPLEELDQERQPLLDKVKELFVYYQSLPKEGEEALSVDELFDPLEKAAKLLFGEEYILLKPLKVSESVVNSIASKTQATLLGDEDMAGEWGQLRVQTWLQELAMVNKGPAAYEEWQMIQRVWQENQGMNTIIDDLKVVQSLTGNPYPWVGLAKDEIDHLLASNHYADKPPYSDAGGTYPDGDRYYPAGVESLVLVINEKQKLETGRNYYGLVLDEFSEHIPDGQIDTGLSFSYNAPNNEAPQCLLLALLNPYQTAEEKNRALANILRQTMDLYKVRMADPQSIQDYLDNKEDDSGSILAFLPLINEINIPTIN